MLTLEHLRQSWRQVFVAHLAFTALGVVLFAPLIGLASQLLLRLSGQPALADQDIAYFVLSPPGMLALILFAALLTVILAFEQAALMRIAISVMHSQRVGTVEALLYPTLRLHRMFLFTAKLVTRVLVLILPFIAVAAGLAFFLITDYDINYYLAEKPIEFWMAVGTIGVVILAMAALLVHKLVGWLLALPLVLFGEVPPAGSFGASVRITQGNRALIYTVLAIWGGLAFLLSAAVLGAIALLGSWIIPQASESIGPLVVLLGGFPHSGCWATFWLALSCSAALPTWSWCSINSLVLVSMRD